LYHWAKTDVMPEDRPHDEEYTNDERFDKWLETFERRMAQQTSERVSMQRDLASKRKRH